jgi:hypothetical protein
LCIKVSRVERRERVARFLIVADLQWSHLPAPPSNVLTTGNA